MSKLPGVNHLRAIKALEKSGFQIDRQGKHIFMSKGSTKVVVPRNNPVDAYTMAAIVRDAGMTIEQFKRLALKLPPQRFHHSYRKPLTMRESESPNGKDIRASRISRFAAEVTKFAPLTTGGLGVAGRGL